MNTHLVEEGQREIHLLHWISMYLTRNLDIAEMRDHVLELLRLAVALSIMVNSEREDISKGAETLGESHCLPETRLITGIASGY